MIQLKCCQKRLSIFLDVFSQVSEENGKLNFAKFEAYLKEILKVLQRSREKSLFSKLRM